MIGKDKVLHFSICATAALLSGFFLGYFSGVMVGLSLGLGKEYGDMVAKGNSWSWADVLADLLGSLFGALLVYMFRMICSF